MNTHIPNSDPLQAILSRLEGVRKAGKDKWQAFCPIHENPPDGHKRSLSIARAEKGTPLIYCHSCGKEATPAILEAIGLNGKGVFAPPKKGRSKSGKLFNIIATYDYLDALGKLLFQVVRLHPKDFRQRRPNGKSGWIWNLNGVSRVLYHLPELLAADPSAWIFIVEGEKDVENLRGIGLVATTNPGGAGKWSKLSDDSVLHGRRVAIIADKDAPGLAHSQDVAPRLYGKAAVVKVINLPDGEVDGWPIKDVSDWLDSLDCRTPEELAAALVSMAEDAPIWTPKADGPSATPAVSGPVLTSLADVKPEPVKWLWPSRFAIGKLTLLAGDPGLGKSFITLDMAARVSKGDGWPDFPASTGRPGGVVLLNAEDDLADTIRPRLDAAGADVSRIKALVAVKHFDFEAGGEKQHPFNLTQDLAALEQAVQDVADCRLVIIDPISAYLGRTDSHKNAEIRGLLAPLSELAARHGVALVAVTHLRKGEGPAMYRAMGSLAFVAAARAAFAVTKDKDDPTGQRRLMLPVKNNLGNDRTGLAYRLVDTFSANRQPVVKWEADPVEISADEALRPDNGRGDGDTSALDEAKDWLQDALVNGPRPVKEILVQTRHDGISKRTLDRAKKTLNVAVSKKGFNAGWTWRLPGAPASPAQAEDRHPQECQNPQQETLATFGDVGNLRQKPKEFGDSENVSEDDSAEDCQAERAGNVQTVEIIKRK